MTTLLAIPGARAVLAHRLPLQRRMEMLRWLAAHADDLAPEVVSLCVAAWSADELSDAEVEIAWRGFRAAADALDGVLTGRLDWRDVDPELRCCERMEAAREIAAQDEEGALAVLAGATTMGEI